MACRSIATLCAGGHYPRLYLGLLWSGSLAGYTGGWLVQIICFCVGSLVALWLLQPMMCRWFASHDAKTGMDALIGRHVFVTETIPTGDAGGRVAVDGVSWRAISHSSQDLPVGQEVRIVGYKSVILEVEPVHP